MKPRSVPGTAAWYEVIVNPVLQLNRLARIALVTLIALVVVLVIVPVIDSIYLNNFYSPTTVIIPSLITAALGIACYAAGWLLIVGMAGSTPPARPAAALYLLGAILALIVMVILVLSGAVDAMQV